MQRGQRGGGSAANEGRRAAADDTTVASYWRKAVALLDDRERGIDTGGCVLLNDLTAFFDSPCWELPGVAPDRDALNEAKGLLDDMDNTAWDQMAQTANYTEYVRRDLRKLFQVELATVAWAKMYELIVRFDLLPESQATVPVADCSSDASAARTAHTQDNIEGRGGAGCDSCSTGSTPCACTPPAPPRRTATPRATPNAVTVHLCEAPGGFVAACNHFLRTHRPEWRWDWLAVSLNPYYGGNDQFAMVDDDAFMRATLPHWSFGADDSGDVRRPDNIRAIWAAARRRFAAAGVPGALLVTADGAIDTSMVPAAQELVNAPLHYAEVVAALGLLAPGGSFLWKGFTLFEHTSLGLLHLAGCAFERVAVCKPCTSKACNSEVYVVCRGFRGVPQPVLEQLLSKCGEDVFLEGAMLPLSLMPESFLDSVLAAARHFARCTSEAIRDALDKSGLPPSGPTATAIRRVKERFAAEWFLRMQVLRLERRFFVAPQEAIDGSNNSTSNVLGRRRELVGTLQERQEQYRRRRNDLGLDGGAIAVAAALQGRWLSTSAGSAGLSTSLASSPGCGYSRSPGMGVGLGLGLGLGCDEAGSRAGLGYSGRCESGAAGLGLGRACGAGPEGVGCSLEMMEGGSRGGIGFGTGDSGGGGDGGGMNMSGTIAKLMAKMGYKEGSGLGRHGQGIAEALQPVANTGRAGLGLGSAREGGFSAGLGLGCGLSRGGGDGFVSAGLAFGGPGLGLRRSSSDGGLDVGPDGGGEADGAAATVPRSCWAPAPDAAVLLNDRPLSAAEVASWSTGCTAGADSSADAAVGRAGGSAAGNVNLGKQAPPSKLTKSKLIIDDRVLVALRRAREAYSAASADASSKAAATPSLTSASTATVGLCRHVPPVCVAPRRRGAGSAGRSYWKLASLDAAFSLARRSAANAAARGSQPRALDLSLHSAGATDYLLRAVGQPCGAADGPSKPRYRRCKGKGSGGSGDESSGGGAGAIGSSSNASGTESDGDGDGDGAAGSGGENSTDFGGTVSAASSGDGHHRISGCAASAAGPASAPWSCTMLATDAASVYASQLQPQEAGRLRLQPVAALQADALGRAAPLSLFTPDTSRQLANSLVGDAADADADADASGGGGAAATAVSRPKGHHCRGLYDIVLGDLGSLRRTRCGWPPSSCGVLEGEYDTLYRRRLLWEAATALAALAPGGAAVLRLGDCLTMFSASVLYVLHRSFAQLAVVKPFASCACSPERFVVAMGRLEDGGAAAAQLLAGLAAVREVEVAAALRVEMAAPVAGPAPVPPEARLACGAAGLPECPCGAQSGACSGKHLQEPPCIGATPAAGREDSGCADSRADDARPLELESAIAGPCACGKLADALAAVGFGELRAAGRAPGRVAGAQEGAEDAVADRAASAPAMHMYVPGPNAGAKPCGGARSASVAPGVVAGNAAARGGCSAGAATTAGFAAYAVARLGVDPAAEPKVAGPGCSAAPPARVSLGSEASAAPSAGAAASTGAAAAAAAAPGNVCNLAAGNVCSSAAGNVCSSPADSPPRSDAGGGGDVRPMAVTGVAPLSACVSGDFYVYLAARTQELASRQVRASEAALVWAPAAAASVALPRQGGGADREGHAGGGLGSEPGPPSLDEQYEMVVRQAEKALADGLARGDTEAGGKNVYVFGGGDARISPRRKYANLFSRGSKAFTVGSAPVRSGWVRAAALTAVAEAAADAARPDDWPSTLGRPGAGLGCHTGAKGCIATAAGPPPSRDGVPSWSYVRNGGAVCAHSPPGTIDDGCNGCETPGLGAQGNRRGGGGGGTGVGLGGGFSGRQCGGTSGRRTGAGRWQSSSSYCDANPPAVGSVPSGASTPYGASPPFHKSPHYARSPPAGGVDGFGSYGQSPLQPSESSWHDRSSAPWGSLRRQRQSGGSQQHARLSSSWDRGGVGNGGGGGGGGGRGGHLTHRLVAAADVAEYAVCGALGAEEPGSFGSSLSSSGRLIAWACEGRGGSRKDGAQACTARGQGDRGAGMGSESCRRQGMRGNSWRTGSGKARREAQFGSAPSVGRVLGPKTDEEGWELVVGSGRRRA